MPADDPIGFIELTRNFLTIQGEPDLSIAERTSVVLGILQRSPATFLQRWGSYVAAPLLKYFDQYEDYAVVYPLMSISLFHSLLL